MAPRLLSSSSTVRDLRDCGLLHKLGHADLVVFLNILAEAEGRRLIEIKNSDLHPQRRTAVLALRSLEDAGWIITKYEKTTHAASTRTIAIRRRRV